MKAIPLLGGLGVLVTGYLLSTKLRGAAPFCAGSGGCETVSSSPYSEIGGIPIALLGLGVYLGIVFLSLWHTAGGKGDLPLLGLFGLSMSGSIYSAWLTYLQLFVLRAVCIWCLTSAFLMVTIFLLVLRSCLRWPGDLPIEGN